MAIEFFTVRNYISIPLRDKLVTVSSQFFCVFIDRRRRSWISNETRLLYRVFLFFFLFLISRVGESDKPNANAGLCTIIMQMSLSFGNGIPRCVRPMIPHSVFDIASAASILFVFFYFYLFYFFFAFRRFFLFDCGRHLAARKSFPNFWGKKNFIALCITK